jgi:hypothetical protein
VTTRRAPAPITVTVTAVTAIRITVTILVIITTTAVTITTVARVPVVTTTTITAIPAIPTIVRVPVGRATMSHVLARSGSMGPISYGIVDADPTAIQVLFYQMRFRKKKYIQIDKNTYNTIKFIDALRGFLDSAHPDKTKTTRPVRLIRGLMVK